MKPIAALLCIVLLTMAAFSCSRKPEIVLPPGSQEQGAEDTFQVADCKRCMVLAEQIQPAVVIVDAGRSGQVMWSWYPGESNIAPAHVPWFAQIDDVKPIYNRQYLLITSSARGAALIRIADKKVLWYTSPGINPHSCEVLPDGNIVIASSTDNHLLLYHTDTTNAYAASPQQIKTVPFAHNVVWDRKRQLLWAAGQNKLYSFRYNFNCSQPDLIPQDTFLLPGTQAHDLFPVYGKDSLWLTNPAGTYVVDLQTMDIARAQTDYQKNIKSVSSGPEGWPTLIQNPTTSYWSDGILDFDGNTVFRHSGWKIYKARWFLPNPFSYDGSDQLKVCD